MNAECYLKIDATDDENLVVTAEVVLKDENGEVLDRFPFGVSGGLYGREYENRWP